MFLIPSTIGLCSKIPVVPVTKTYETQSHADPTGASTHTFSSQDLGSSGTKKIVIAVAAHVGAPTSAVLSNVQIDPGSGLVNCTELVNVKPSSWSYSTALWSIETITAATGDVKLTATGATSFEWDIWIYTLIGAAASVNDTASDIVASSKVLSANLDIPAGGAAIGFAIFSGAAMNNVTTTWSNLTKDNDTSTNESGGNVYIIGSSASKTFDTAQSGLTITDTANATSSINDSNGCAMVLASWGPA